MMRRAQEIMRNPFVVLPLAALIVVGAYVGIKSRPDSGEDSTSLPTEQVVAVTTGSMALSVSAQGTVAAAVTQDLSFGSSGTVTAVNVAAGDTVAAGDVLATIDSAELTAAVADATTALAQAEAKLSDDTDNEASETQLAADQSSVTTAQDRLSAAWEALAGARIVATDAGTVSLVNLTVGEQLATAGLGGTSRTGSGSGTGASSSTLGSTSSSVGPGGGSGAASSASSGTTSPRIQVVSTGSYSVSLGFDSTDIANLKVGQPASVTLATGNATTTDQMRGIQGAVSSGSVLTGSPSTGSVTEVGKIASAASGVATYPVTVAFTDDSGSINIGSTVDVVISYQELADVISVPSMAVTGSGSEATVTVRPSGANNATSDQVRSVTTGVTSNGMVQISSGLASDESVVIRIRRADPSRQADDSENSSDATSGVGPGGGFGPPPGFDPNQMGGAPNGAPIAGGPGQ